MISVDEIYLPQSVAWSLRHMDEVDSDTRADIERCLALLPPPDAALLTYYSAGYSAREALSLLHQRGDPYKRFRAALSDLVRMLNGGNHGVDRSDRAATVRQNNPRA